MALYGSTAAAYALVFLRRTPSRGRVATAILSATILLHIAYLWTAGLLGPHPPLYSVFEAMGVLALAVALVYLHVESRLGEKTTGVFLVTLATMLMALSAVLTDSTLEPREVMLSHPGLVAHIAPALIAYAGFTSAFIYSLLLLLLHQSLKKNRFGIIFDRFPPLEALGDMAIRSTVFGLIFLTIAIVAGIVFSAHAFRMENLRDPKILSVFAGWVLFAGALGARVVLRWGYRRTALLSILAFTVLILSMTVLTPLLSRYHGFK